MPSFAYVARETGSGREMQGSLSAAGSLGLAEARFAGSLDCGEGPQTRPDQRRAVGLADLVIFTRQLATMVDAGLAIVQCLQAWRIRPQQSHARHHSDVCARVESGDSFSEALQKHPKVFDRLYVRTPAAGVEFFVVFLEKKIFPLLISSSGNMVKMALSYSIRSGRAILFPPGELNG